MASVTAIEKRHRRLKKESWEINEPEFNILDYEHSMLLSLNYYSKEVDSKLKKQWSLDFYKSKDKSIKNFEKLSDSCYNQTGALIRLINRGIPLSDNHSNYLEFKYTELQELVNENYSDSDIPKEKSIKKEPKVDNSNLIKILNSLEVEVDRILFDGLDGIIPKKIIINSKATKIELTEISKEYSRLINYYSKILESTDEDIIYGYGNLTKKNIKKVLAYCNTVIESCKSKPTAKISSKPKKEKSPKVLVSKLKYQKEFNELNLNSIQPEKIIGSSEVWLYNTRLRKLIRYKTIDGLTLTVKGTTLLNWDSDLSGSKILRNPEVQLKEFINSSKPSMNKFFLELKSMKTNINGRTNDDLIILKSF